MGERCGDGEGGREGGGERCSDEEGGRGVRGVVMRGEGWREGGG